MDFLVWWHTGAGFKQFFYRIFMNDNCEQCGGKCKSPFAGEKNKFSGRCNHYWHVAKKYEKENVKPNCCDDCGKLDDNLKFVEEPFLAEICHEHFAIWMCDDCHYQRRMDI
jgi:hypothetical protein